MSTTYIGNPAGVQAPSPAPAQNAVPESVIPSDGDALNVASITQFAKMLTDYAAWTTANAGILGGTNSWTGPNNWTGSTTFAQNILSTTGNSSAALVTTTSPATGHRKLIAGFLVGGGGVSSDIAIYVQGDWFLEFVINALWDDTGLVWNRVTAGHQSSKFTLFANGLRMSTQTAGGPNTWADGAWVNNNNIEIDSITSFIRLLVGGNIDITSSSGHANLTSTSSNITLSSGNDTNLSSNHDINLTAANILKLTPNVGCVSVGGSSMGMGNVSLGGPTPFDLVTGINGTNTSGSVLAQKQFAGNTDRPTITISWVGAPLASAPRIAISPIAHSLIPPCAVLTNVDVNGFTILFMEGNGGYPNGNGDNYGFQWIALQS